MKVLLLLFHGRCAYGYGLKSGSFSSFFSLELKFQGIPSLGLSVSLLDHGDTKSSQVLLFPSRRKGKSSTIIWKRKKTNHDSLKRKENNLKSLYYELKGINQWS